MGSDQAADVIDWVRAGQHLFGAVLEKLQRSDALQARSDAVEAENRELRETIRELRRELECLRSERIEVADTLRGFAEQVARLAILAIQRLGAHRAPPDGSCPDSGRAAEPRSGSGS